MVTHSFQIFKASHNKLSYLVSRMDLMTKLRSVDLSHNMVVCLFLDWNEMKSLRVLDLYDNRYYFTKTSGEAMTHRTWSIPFDLENLNSYWVSSGSLSLPPSSQVPIEYLNLPNSVYLDDFASSSCEAMTHRPWSISFELDILGFLFL